MEWLRTRLAIDNRTFTPSGIGAKAKLGIAQSQGLAHAPLLNAPPATQAILHRISPL